MHRCGYGGNLAEEVRSYFIPDFSNCSAGQPRKRVGLTAHNPGFVMVDYFGFLRCDECRRRSGR